MDLKDTVHLPRTDFPMRASLSEREPKQIAAWDESGLYQRILEKNRGNDKFVFHDGPPYANGSIHLGHCLNKILKDMVVKFRSLQGRLTDFIPGWDCHGLPIELQVDKQLGPKKKELTQAQFRRACRKYAEEQVDIQRREFKRLGVLANWNDPYLTMSYGYEAQTVRELARIARRGALYRRKRPVHWCLKDGTALAEAEVEYADKVSPSIYVGFQVTDATPLVKAAPALEGKKLVLAAWTTTPWTIPANLAITANPDIDYVAYDLDERGVVVVAKDLLAPFLKAVAPGELGPGPSVESAPELVATAHAVARTPALRDHARVVAHLKGSDLSGAKYQHPLADRQGVVVLGAHATTEAGTGLVHTAPGHGEDDFHMGVQYGLPIWAPVDGYGRYTQDVGIAGLEGMKVFDANPVVVEKLQNVGALLNATGKAFDYPHSYPHCWRCKNPVIFRATDQWWIALDQKLGDGHTIRADALKSIDDIGEKNGWIPSWGKERIRAMVENRPDWCISRQRSWGVPIPVVYCSKCREPLVSADAMEHVASIFDQEGADAWFDRPVSELLPKGVSCQKCGGSEFEKETDILDVWFDSGSSFAAVLASGRWPDVRVPADLYLEGSDQHRGWFMSSLMIGIAGHQAAPYKAVLTHGFTVGADGHKLSKSKGDTAEAYIKKYGAEVLRLWVAASDFRGDIALSQTIMDQLSDDYRKIRNTLRYCLSQLFDFDPARDAVPAESLGSLDRWALSRLERYRSTVVAAYETYEFHKVHRATVELCATDLSAFYFDVLKDRTYCSGKNWPERRAAQTVLFHLARDLCRLLAPLASFTAEEAWQHLPKGGLAGEDARPDSVFLAGLPKAQPERLDDSLEEEFRVLAGFRAAVNLRLEEKRVAKELGKATEADVVLRLSKDAAQGFEGEVAQKHEKLLADLFLCGSVSLEIDPQLAGRSADARVTKSANKPCQRCWRALPDVQGEPALCARCARAVKE